MTDTAALRKRAMYDPQSVTQKEWDAIHKVAFSTPKDNSPSDDIKVTRSDSKQKKKGSWW